MPTKSHTLTKMEQRYKENRIAGMLPVPAAQAAGYKAPEAAAARLEDVAEIVREVRAAQAIWLQNEAIELAQNVVVEVLRDARAKHSDRLTAARLVFQETRGFIETGEGGADDDAPMTLAELQAEIAALEKQRLEQEAGLKDITTAKVVQVDPFS